MGTRLKGLLYISMLAIGFQCNTFAQPAAIVVLILDDLGNNLALGQRAIRLPGNINYSFLPQSPNGAALAKAAYQQGKEVMLHIPMSNIKERQMGPGALTAAMDKTQFIATLHKNLQSIPHVRGVNNHMGSLLTQLQQPMSWFIKELKQQQLYFVDSRTSPLSVAESLAQHYGLPHLRRHIFLDNQRNEQAIAKQFERLITLAKKQGIGVAIGHPHPETLHFLEQTLPLLDSKGIRLAFVSEITNSTERRQKNERNLENSDGKYLKFSGLPSNLLKPN